MASRARARGGAGQGDGIRLGGGAGDGAGGSDGGDSGASTVTITPPSGQETPPVAGARARASGKLSAEMQQKRDELREAIVSGVLFVGSFLPDMIRPSELEIRSIVDPALRIVFRRYKKVFHDDDVYDLVQIGLGIGLYTLRVVFTARFLAASRAATAPGVRPGPAQAGTPGPSSPGGGGSGDSLSDSDRLAAVMDYVPWRPSGTAGEPAQ